MTLLPDTPLFPTGQDHYKDWQGLSDGSLAAVLAEVARTADGPLLVAAPDSSRAQQLADALGFYLAGNPGAAGDMNTPFILGMVLIESIAIYGLLIGLLLVFKF